MDTSTIQLVGYQTSQEEIGELFHQVYKVEEAAWAPTVQAQMSEGSNQGHLVFFEGLPTAEER